MVVLQETQQLMLGGNKVSKIYYTLVITGTLMILIGIIFSILGVY